MINHGYIVAYMADVPCIKWAALEMSKPELFKESVLEAAALYRERKINHQHLKVLIDLADMVDSPLIDLKWLNNVVMIDLYEKNGVRNVAIVAPKRFKSFYLFKELFDKNEQVHNVSAFDNEGEALEWLRGEPDELPGGRFEYYGNR